MAWWHALQHWLAIHTGTLNEPGPYYGFWSGFGSDLAEFAAAFAFITGAVVSYRHKNCHVKGCLRLGRHPAAGGQFTVCRKHSPDPAVREGLTAHHIHSRHREHLAAQGEPRHDHPA